MPESRARHGQRARVSQSPTSPLFEEFFDRSGDNFINVAWDNCSDSAIKRAQRQTNFIDCCATTTNISADAKRFKCCLKWFGIKDWVYLFNNFAGHFEKVTLIRQWNEHLLGTIIHDDA
jgi:hypothetical protein